MINKMAGKPASRDMLENIPSLVSAYFTLKPNPDIKNEAVSFGTSGHRGNAYKKSFNEDHVKAISQAICDYRKEKGIDGILYLGKDTHALSTPAQITALEVFAANEVKVAIAKDNEYIPTPLISFAILEKNKTADKLSDGVVITPSHNPPSDGGYKYNPPNGGPADTDITDMIQNRANEILKHSLREVKSVSYEKALQLKHIMQYDYITPYVNSLNEIIDMDLIKKSGLKIAANPLGGTAMGVYKKINELYGLNIDIINPFVDPTFSFMHLDHDGKIRMDCSSAYAMRGVIELKDKYDIAFGNDVDADRHGIVTPKGGLIDPNHYLSIAIWYLFKYRDWDKNLKIGKTLVSSSMIDRVGASLKKEVYEVPVGFKWFSNGLFEGKLGFAGEESAGASFLRFDGSVWTTDKDGIILDLLSAEILAKTKKDLSDIYSDFEKEFGKSYYERIDAPASKEQKEILKKIDPKDINEKTIGGEEIECIYTKASGNGAKIGGLKIVSKNGWVALRPSGTEDIYKIYAESFISKEHLKSLQQEARNIVKKIFKDKL